MIPSKTPAQIRSHFDSFYVGADSLEPALRPPPTGMRSDLCLPPTFCALPLIAPLENPPRPALRIPKSSSSGGSCLSKELHDYNPARSEFCVEYDNAAERDIVFITRDPVEETLLWPSHRQGPRGRGAGLENESEDDETTTLLTALATAVFDRYNRRLRRRAEVKRLVREHGLISWRRVQAAAGRLQGVKCAGWRSAHQWRGVCQLVSDGAELDRVLEALLLEADIKCNILKLQKLRTEGKCNFKSLLFFLFL